MLLCEFLLLGDVVMGFRLLVAARCRPTHLGNFPGVGLRRLMNSLGERFRLHQRIVVICVVVGCLGRVPLCLLRKIDIRRRPTLTKLHKLHSLLTLWAGRGGGANSC